MHAQLRYIFDRESAEESSRLETSGDAAKQLASKEFRSYKSQEYRLVYLQSNRVCKESLVSIEVTDQAINE